MPAESETAEDIAAGLLNGLMIFLLGAAFPALFVWMAISRGGDWKIGSDPDSLTAAGQGVTLAIFSFFFMRSGLRMARESLAALRRKRDPEFPET